MNDLITISGVRGYIDENGAAQLNLEDVARGLGFTTVATSGNECVRWNTVHNYLCGFGVATSCNGSDYRSICPEFIPENIFFRLAMKAKNEAAEIFQGKVADEILPSIRKHGAYMTPATMEQMITDPSFGIKLLTALQDEQSKRKALEVETEHKQAVIEGFVGGISLDQKRQIINRILRKGFGGAEKQRDRWHMAYAQFEMLCHVNIAQRMNNWEDRMSAPWKKSKIEFIEKQMEMLDEFYEVVVKLFETDVEAVKKELFAS